ncbi:hypothetical protein [Natronomonas marina]|jgi:hypothetical protein|uniref:hypothetical protein n=1 Tax=Natronomonas marina TaxID=2961939 RepID=UPI0020C9C095|nr:hypothetical protein [Natronomonas marina]
MRIDSRFHARFGDVVGGRSVVDAFEARAFVGRCRGAVATFGERTLSPGNAGGGAE